jgi:glycosyltransferase involved in cell wall biosynthesis
VRVSIVIPTFERARLLTRALGSIRAQTHPDWEALVIDDGHGQGIRAAEAFGDRRIRAWPNKGKGQVEARNTALQHATGEAVALLDDDDWWVDTAHLAQIVAVLRGGPALVHRPGWLVYEQDVQEIRREPFLHKTTPQSLRENNTVLASSLAYPKQFHDELGAFDPEVGSYYDWDWILRVLDAGYGLHTLPTPGVGYSVREDGASAVPDTPKRRANFEMFREKHGLQIVIKNHASLHAETAAEET